MRGAPAGRLPAGGTCLGACLLACADPCGPACRARGLWPGRSAGRAGESAGRVGGPVCGAPSFWAVNLADTAKDCMVLGLVFNHGGLGECLS